MKTFLFLTLYIAKCTITFLQNIHTQIKYTWKIQFCKIIWTPGKRSLWHIMMSRRPLMESGSERYGLIGKVWQLLYLSYKNFWCKARMNGQYSNWYQMECGIHQGEYLSLLKYTAFIDPLIRDIERSGHGCCITGISTSPLGYTDDIATACFSKGIRTFYQVEVQV